ncbi:M14 family metallopeptidase [Clostridium sp. LBM24168]
MPVLKLGDRGNQVMRIQSVLKKLGYYSGAVDGIFGTQTENAVKKFQERNRLVSDGIIGQNTYRIFERFIDGFDNYTIKPGDTLYKIARMYGTQVNRIIIANPQIQPFGLIPGTTIKIPYNIDIVDTDINYTYEIMESDIFSLKARYPFLNIGTAGKSVLGRELYYIKLGTGPNEVFYNGSHHALEWITTPLLMKFAENFLKAYTEGRDIREYDIENIWRNSSIYIVPMVNPDGVDLVLNGLMRSNPYYDDLIVWNNGSENFSRDWEANNRGVDLNHNYDAGWELSKAAEASYGVYGPGPTRYSGPSPVSEPETKSMVDFTRDHDFRLVLAYHSQGQVIYWQYDDLTPSESREIGEQLAEVSGYTLEETTGITSYSGYKDWFIQDFRRPGFTIEVGKGVNPLPISQFQEIYDDNEELLILASVI